MASRWFWIIAVFFGIFLLSCGEDGSSSDENGADTSDGDYYSDGDRPQSDGDSDFEGYELEEDPEPIRLRGRVFVPDDVSDVPLSVRLEVSGQVVQNLELEPRGERSFVPFLFSALESGRYELHGILHLNDWTNGSREDIHRAYSENPLEMNLDEQDEYGPVDLRIGFSSVSDGDEEDDSQDGEEPSLDGDDEEPGEEEWDDELEPEEETDGDEEPETAEDDEPAANEDGDASYHEVDGDEDALDSAL